MLKLFVEKKVYGKINGKINVFAAKKSVQISELW